ncbi:fluoride efflux transporter FluC [Aliidiomarina soli]|uniref:Fluoride-specific ion channel FluC n=1 Tax=Aliidiomarina soli TaxID=1928574 RepID=A0A432WHS2_9GAMM|nr:CrcB family protein [Aliidiomarina soli]RUO33305.1 hypothetical protein CWE14_08780 [Aliidiomarina soli]
MSPVGRAILLVFVGGTLGSMARLTVSLLLYQHYLGAGNHYTVAMAATLAVNVIGSFALGALAALRQHKRISTVLWLLLGVGGLGAFTTFSAMALDTFIAIQLAHWSLAGLYVVATIAGSVSAAALSYVWTLYLTRSPRVSA